jgi:hypothetical protein
MSLIRTNRNFSTCETLPPQQKSHPSDRHLNRYLWLLLVVTNVVDVLASRRAFEFGIEELNPIVDSVLSAYGIWGIALFKALWLGVLLVLLPHIRGWTRMLLAFACLAYFALTVLHIWNLSPLL